MTAQYMDDYNMDTLDIQADQYEEQQLIMQGLNEIDATMKLFGMSFEDAAQFLTEDITNQIKTLQNRLDAITATVPQ